MYYSAAMSGSGDQALQIGAAIGHSMATPWSHTTDPNVVNAIVAAHRAQTVTAGGTAARLASMMPLLIIGAGAVFLVGMFLMRPRED